MNIPQITKSLLLANIAVFIIDELMGKQLSVSFGLFYFESPFFHIWQPVTYMFIHAGISHLFFNMFALFMFGRIMETYWGAKRFLTFYLICGIGAAVIQELGQITGLIEPYAHTVGASGAVYGILLAFGMTFPEEKLFIIPIPFPIKAKYFVGFYAIIEILEGCFSNDSVAHFAHLGGMLFGAILILWWRQQEKKRRNSNYSWTQSSTYGTYDKGNDESVFNKIGNALKGNKKPKMTITYGDRAADYKFNEEKKKNDEEIDRILDKVRKGGYSSLTAEEKAALFDASKR